MSECSDGATRGVCRSKIASHAKIEYQGSLLLLIFWLIFFFPIAFVLLLTASAFIINQKRYLIRYDGSRFWLCFWVLFCFPIAFLLLFINGLSMYVEDLSVE